MTPTVPQGADSHTVFPKQNTLAHQQAQPRGAASQQQQSTHRGPLTRDRTSD